MLFTMKMKFEHFTRLVIFQNSSLVSKCTLRIMCHNPGTWHDFSQVKLTSEESCQWANYKTKYKLESKNPLGNNCTSLTWEQLCQSHLGTIVPVSLRNNPAILTLEQLCQSHLGTMVPVSLGKQSYQSHLRNICASLIWE